MNAANNFGQKTWIHGWSWILFPLKADIMSWNKSGNQWYAPSTRDSKMEHCQSWREQISFQTVHYGMAKTCKFAATVIIAPSYNIIIFKGTPHNQRTPPIIKKRKRNAQTPSSITIDRGLRHFIGLPLNWVQNSVVLNPPRAGFIRVSRYQTNTIQSAAQNSPMWHLATNGHRTSRFSSSRTPARAELYGELPFRYIDLLSPASPTRLIQHAFGDSSLCLNEESDVCPMEEGGLRDQAWYFLIAHPDCRHAPCCQHTLIAVNNGRATSLSRRYWKPRHVSWSHLIRFAGLEISLYCIWHLRTHFSLYEQLLLALLPFTGNPL